MKTFLPHVLKLFVKGTTPYDEFLHGEQSIGCVATLRKHKIETLISTTMAKSTIQSPNHGDAYEGCASKYQRAFSVALLH